MDFFDLRIVNPRDKDIVANAYESASHAKEILDNAVVYNSIDDAVADLSFVAMTSGRVRDIEKKEIYLEKLSNEICGHEKIGIVFGSERTGLTNEELVLADVIVSMHTGLNKSFNLSHAVGIVLYEVFSKNLNPEILPIKKDVATKREIAMFLDKLTANLESRGYFKEAEKKKGQLINIKNLFTRDYLTKQDIKTLYGLLKS